MQHYSRDPVAVVRSVEQDPNGRWDKPRGLWVSVAGPDDWPSWCESEGFGDVAAKLAHEVVLADDAHILHLRSGFDVFGLAVDYEREMPHAYYSRGDAIDWVRVADEYDGIIIAPYQWSCRLTPETSWYYSWDCASGCIWNAAAVASIRVRAPMKPSRKERHGDDVRAL